MMRNRRFEQGVLKAERILRDRETRWYHYNVDEMSQHEQGRILGLLRETHKSCSCWMCGNPRRIHGEVTLGEIKQLCEGDEQLEELGINRPRRHWGWWS
jgi:hypothetical protein